MERYRIVSIDISANVWALQERTLFIMWKTISTGNRDEVILKLGEQVGPSWVQRVTKSCSRAIGNEASASPGGAGLCTDAMSTSTPGCVTLGSESRSQALIPGDMFILTTDAEYRCSYKRGRPMRIKIPAGSEGFVNSIGEYVFPGLRRGGHIPYVDFTFAEHLVKVDPTKLGVDLDNIKQAYVK
jgi:hypothetical protein